MNYQHNQPTESKHDSSSEPAHAPTVKQGEWEQPDFEEFDLCMEVTTYIRLLA